MYDDIIMSAEYFIRLREFSEEDGVVGWLLENGFTANSAMFESIFDPPPPILHPRKKQSAIRADAQSISSAQYTAPGKSET